MWKYKVLINSGCNETSFLSCVVQLLLVPCGTSVFMWFVLYFYLIKYLAIVLGSWKSGEKLILLCFRVGQLIFAYFLHAEFLILSVCSYIWQEVSQDQQNVCLIIQCCPGEWGSSPFYHPPKFQQGNMLTFPPSESLEGEAQELG